MKQPPIQRLIDLQAFLLKFRNIERVVHVHDGTNQVLENDIEHSYSLAMVGWYLARFFPELNKDLVIRSALAHDIVEVYAGDTYVFADESELATKTSREAAAARQISSEWHDFPDLNHTIESYESRGTAEARFVYALDKIMPIILIYLNQGYTWHAEKLTLEKLHANKADKVAVSPEIKPYYDQLYELLLQNKDLFADTAKQ